MARQLLTIHIGQAGVQIGNAFWELFSLEHGINTDGTERDFVKEDEWAQKTARYLFYESQKTGKFVPRAVHVDLEPTVLDEIRTGPYRQFYHPSCLLNLKEDASNNFARGFYTQGKKILQQTLDIIRLQANKCESLTGFNLVQSFSGGTGAGLSSLLSEKLTDLYGKKFKFAFSIYPSARLASAIVDPYNAILHCHSGMEHLDCEILVDNETLFQKCMVNLKVPSPTFTTINRIIAQMTSSVFQSHNYYALGSQRADTCQLLTNLIPYPRIHYPIVSYAPICSFEYCDHETFNCKEITESAFTMETQTLDCNTATNKYISCAMMYRGSFAPIDVHEALSRVKNQREISFVDWCPTGFKIGINLAPPFSVHGSEMSLGSKSLCMLAGNTAVKEVWVRTLNKYNLLYSKRAFVHWYVGEGMEEGEFAEANDNILALQRDYEEIALESTSDGENEDANYYKKPNQTKNQAKPIQASQPKPMAPVQKYFSKSSMNSEIPERMEPIQKQSSKSHHSYGSQPVDPIQRQSSKSQHSNITSQAMDPIQRQSSKSHHSNAGQPVDPIQRQSSKSQHSNIASQAMDPIQRQSTKSHQSMTSQQAALSKKQSTKSSIQSVVLPRSISKQSLHSIPEPDEESLDPFGPDTDGINNDDMEAPETPVDEEYKNLGKDPDDYVNGGLSSESNRSNHDSSKNFSRNMLLETGDLHGVESMNALQDSWKDLQYESEKYKYTRKVLNDPRKLLAISEFNDGDGQQTVMPRTRRSRQQSKQKYYKQSGVSIMAAASICGSSSSTKSKEDAVDDAITRLQSSTFTTQEAIDFLKGIANKQAMSRNVNNVGDFDFGANQNNSQGQRFVSSKSIPPLINDDSQSASLSLVPQINQSNRNTRYEDQMNDPLRQYRRQRAGMLTFSSLEAIECPVAFESNINLRVTQNVPDISHSSYSTISNPYEEGYKSSTPDSQINHFHDKRFSTSRTKKHFVSSKFIKIGGNQTDSVDNTKQTRQ